MMSRFVVSLLLLLSGPTLAQEWNWQEELPRYWEQAQPALDAFTRWVLVAREWGLDNKMLGMLLLLLLVVLRCRIDRRRLVAEQRKELRTLAERDPLTGVASRRRIHQLLEQLIDSYQRYQHRFSIILFDLDDFKQVNKRYGLKRGDQALVEACERVSTRLRKMDLIGRWSGEQFIIVCPNILNEQATALAEQLCRQIAESPVAGVSGQTASFGVAECAEGSMTPEALVGLADDALYAARAEGGNSVKSWA